MKKLLTGAVIIVSFLLAISGIPRNVQAVILSPPQIDTGYTPGNTYREELTIFFQKRDSGKFTVTVYKMEAEDMTGNKKVSIPPVEENTLANWITLDETSITKSPDITYQNGDNAYTTGFSIAVPENAPPGTHMAAIVVEERVIEPVTSTPNLAAVEGAVLQLLINVEGDVMEKAIMSTFRIKGDQFLFAHLPVEFETVFINQGNVHVIPRGNIEVMSSLIKINNVSLNPGQLRVFPELSRLYENIWSEEGIEKMTEQSQINQARNNLPKGFFEELVYELKYFRIGLYNANLQGFAGSNQFGGSVSFLVFPWHLFLTIVAVLLSIFFSRKLYLKVRGIEYIPKQSGKYKKAKRK